MTGLVTLLGAGPGDYELITVKGARRLKEADVVVYDRLVNQALFDYLSDSCERIDVGKRPGVSCIRQEEIENILVREAKAGRRVVRLKSGDPYIFGRGGEEAQTLVKAGVSFEVVPGVTSAIAGPTYAGIPLTVRDVATSFHVFTGHLKDETESLNWEAISQLKGTLVFLMGMRNLSTIMAQLSVHGYSKETPVAVVEWGTHPRQRSIDGTLETIEDLVAQENLQAPSVIVVGDVVSFRRELNFHENLPLFGKRILIQASPTGRLPHFLKDDGATLVTFPARTRLEKNLLQLPNLEQVEGVLVADAQSWRIFLETLRQEHIDLRSLSHLKFVAIGHHTAQALEQAGIMLHAMGTQASDVEIKEALSEVGGQWYSIAPSHKVEELESLYALPVLTTHKVDFDARLTPEDWTDLDAICLTNSTAAINFVALVAETGLSIQNVPIIVMGKSTRTVLTKAGFDNIVETDEASIVAIRDKCRQLLK